MEKDILLAKLKSPQEEDRLQGLRDLREVTASSLISSVLEAMGDESWRVRKEAVELFLSQPRSVELAGEVVELLHSEDNAGLRNAAVETLIGLGAAVVPVLLEELNSNDHDVRKFVLDILGDIGDEGTIEAMIGALDDPDTNVRASAAENLGKLRSEEAIPHLLEALQESDLLFRFTVLEALGQIGARVPVERLLDLQGERLLRKALFDCLGRIGGRAAIEPLVAGLQDDMSNVREAAVQGLIGLCRDNRDWVEAALRSEAATGAGEALMKLLDAPAQGTREAAVKLLGLLGDGRFAPRILALLDDDELRECAVGALLAMGEGAVCSLQTLWPGADERQRTYLCYLFGEMACKDASGLLLEGLDAADPQLKLVAAQALGKIREIKATPHLVRCLQDPVEEVRDVALQAIAQIGSEHAGPTLQALNSLQEHQDPELRMYGVQLAGGFDGEAVASWLDFAMKDESPLVRRAAVKALEQKADGAQNKAQGLVLALTDEDSEVRRVAAEALGKCGDPKAIDPLRLALADNDIWVRAAAVRSIGHLGGDGAFALAETALEDEVGLVSIAALETLAAMDPQRAYPSMVRAFSHPDVEVVNAALQLLQGSSSSDWVASEGGRLLNHPNWEVRINFIRTLAQIEGACCRELLEQRLLVEGDDLVGREIRDTLSLLPKGPE